jgi:hypothetical protein
MELWFVYFCCDNGSSDGRDVQTVLTDRMGYQRNVGGFLYFLQVVFGAICETFAFFPPTYFVAFFISMLG